MKYVYLYNEKYRILLKTIFDRFNEAIVFEDFLDLTSLCQKDFKFEFKKGILYYKYEPFEAIEEGFWDFISQDIADYEVDSGDLDYNTFWDLVGHTDFGFRYLNEEEFNEGDISDIHSDLVDALATETIEDLTTMAVDRDIIYYVEYF